MKVITGKYGEGIKNKTKLRKLNLEPHEKLTSNESKELKMLRNISKAKILENKM